MKKLLIVLCAMALSIGAYAQKGVSAAGVSLNVSPVTEKLISVTNFGVSAKYQYGVTDPIRLEAAVGYDFKAKGVSVFHIGINGHWLFDVAERIKVYPIFGLGYANLSGCVSFDDEIDDDYSDYGGYDEDDISSTANKFYYNVGAGGEYAINDRLSANLEVKYQGIQWYNRVPISIGVTYKF